MGIRTTTTQHRACDRCDERLKDDRTSYAVLATRYAWENGHNGDEMESTQSIDLCFTCADNAFPRWRYSK